MNRKMRAGGGTLGLGLLLSTVSSVGLALANDSGKPGSCDPGATDFRYPAAVQTFKDLNAGGTRLAASAVSTVLREYCASADEFVAEAKRSRADVDEKSHPVLKKYVGTLLEDAATGPSLGALIRAEFGAHGFARPVFKPTVLVSFQYAKDVDSVRAGSEDLGKVARALLPIGQIQIDALKGKSTVCSANYDLKRGVPQTFSC